MNRIIINGYTITDSQITSGKLTLVNDMLSSTLKADEARFGIHYEGPAKAPGLLYSSEGDQLFSNEGDALMSWQDQSVTLDLESLPYGTPITYMHNDNVIGRFYLTGATRINKNDWTITAQSAIGILINQEHNGGIYSVANGDTIKSVIDEIMAGLNISYTVSNQIKNQYVAGHLPVASCRDNLLQLCFAFGISILKDVNGDLLFDYNEPEQPEAVLTDGRIYAGGKKTKIMPISKATIYEHAFYAVTSLAPVILFDNTNDVAATNQKIIFENPVIVSTITTTGTISVSESNANYAIVSGVGTLQAVEYTHTIKVLEENTGIATVESKEIVYDNATLVNALNSANCLKRVASYYTTANEVDYDIVVESERPGEMLQYPDPFTDNQVAGLIKQMSIEVSGILKSATKLTEGWLPNHLGNNFTDYELVTSGISWTADKTGTVRIYLVSGGSGGQGGHGGAGGNGGSNWSQGGGAGGVAGNAGAGGKVYALDLEVVQGTTYTISLGSGGSGGAGGSGGGGGDGDGWGNPGTGSAGTVGGAGGDTTITVNGTTYSSASGQQISTGLINQFTGDVYAISGINGIAGANGGNHNRSGGDVSYEDSIWNGGAPGSKDYSWSSGAYGYSGAGGGAAYGANGGNGANAEHYPWQYRIYGGDGGNGAAAQGPISYTPVLGGGGVGGNGGGGGGCGGAAAQGSTDLHPYPGDGGSGGAGSAGGTGGQGFILIYK